MSVKKFTIKNWVNGEYVPLYPKTTADQIIQSSDGRLVTDQQVADWSGKQDDLGFTPENSANKGTAGGYASLDANGKLSVSQIPKEATTETHESSSELSMLGLSAQKGDICIRADISKTFILQSDDPTKIASWKPFKSEIAPVQTVNGQVGSVVITTETISAVNESEVSTTAQAGKILKLDGSGKLPASITGDASTVDGRSINDSLVNSTTVWTSSKVDTEIKNAVAGVVTALDWKESVNTFANISTTYPSPIDGWTVNVKDTDITYRYSGTQWVPISANAIPNASSTLDGKMTKEDKIKMDGIQTGANLYVHPTDHSASIIVEDDQHRFVSTVEKQQFIDNTLYTNDVPTIVTNGGISVGSTFLNKPVNEILTGLLYPYVAPYVSLLAYPTSQIREYGNPISTIELTANTAKKSKAITSVQFYRGANLINTVAVPKAGGGSEIFIVSVPVSESETFKAVIGDGQSSITSGSIDYKFVYPMFVGNVNVQTPTNENIVAMDKMVISKPSQKEKVYTISGSRFCIAYPASYGNLISITDMNQFEILGDFIKDVRNIIGMDGTTQSYNVYTFKNSVTISDFKVTYKF